VTTADPGPRVSTSAQNGAMIRLPVPAIGTGVYVLSGPSKVTLPLLLTQTLLYVVLWMVMGNPSGTEVAVDPSSLAGSELA
jgi:hypothetical protein